MFTTQSFLPPSSSFTHKARKRIWHGVWTLVLLLYAPLAYTCSALIHCPSIPGNGQDEEYVSGLLSVYIINFEAISIKKQGQ